MVEFASHGLTQPLLAARTGFHMGIPLAARTGGLPAHPKAQEVKPLTTVRQPGFLFIEFQATGFQPTGKPLTQGGRLDASKPDVPVVGFTATETRRQPRFWQMIFAFLLLAFAIGGVMLPLVPILRARGVTPEEAAVVQGALGLALIVGRAFAGFLMDRIFVPYVAAAILAFPILGVALLALGATGSAAVVAAVCLGLAAGAELDVIAVLISRYFGTRAYSENYGWQYAAWTLGSGTAPILTNFVFDRTGTHTTILWVYFALFVASALLVLRLGPYPKLEAVAAAPPNSPAGAAS